MANAPLNPPLANNNLLALVLEECYPIAYCDSTEPAGTALTASGNVEATFPTNAFGFHPPVTQGSYGIVVSAVNAATTVSYILEASDGTNFETVDAGSFAVGQGGTRIRKWASSLAAGSDVQGSLVSPVTKLRAVVTLAGSTQAATIKLVAAGTP